ncbi:MAG: hypothetical protein ACKOKC_07905 [Chthoniobacterales bacterium]
MKCFPSTLVTVFALTCALSAQQADEPKPEFDKSKAEKAALPMPNPYDKLLAIEETVGKDKVDWSALADNMAIDVDANEIEGRPDAALALGVKIADGIVAIKAQNAEKLNRSADQLEALGKKLGATDDDLKRARQVREMANRGEWMMVFLELGFLQADIMKKLAAPENKDERTLVIASGWLQGGRYATALIEQNYTPELSNILREPVLAGELNKQVSAVGGELAKSPKVQAVTKAMSEAYPIVNIPLDASISKDDVGKLKSIGDTAVEAVTAE